MGSYVGVCSRCDGYETEGSDRHIQCENCGHYTYAELDIQPVFDPGWDD